MGCLSSKDRLTKEDMEFLKSHTRYDEATIKEWYKGFKVTAYHVIFLVLNLLLTHILIRYKKYCLYTTVHTYYMDVYVCNK